MAKASVLESILRLDRVGGSTPLADITNMVAYNIQALSVSTVIQFKDNVQYDGENDAVNYNLLTDGCPNNPRAFEESLHFLFQQENNVFLTVNLCTDEDAIVNYYEGLDRKFMCECSGMVKK